MKAKELILEISNNISGSNWKPKNMGNSIWLEREVLEGVEYIAFNTIRTHEGFKINGVISCNKAFNDVEEVLIPLYKDFNLEYLHRTIHFNSQRDEECSDVNIVDPESLQKVIPWIQSKLEQEIFPFLNRFETLEAVHQNIMQLEKSEISSFVYAPPVIKVLAIKYILKTEDVEGYSKWAIEVYEEMARGKSSGFEFASLCILKHLSNSFK